MTNPIYKVFPTQGNAFRINNQEMTRYPITLVIHDNSYSSWTLFGEECFSNQFPYAYLGTSPWLNSRTNDAPLPMAHPLNMQLMDLLFSQGEYGTVIYALSEASIQASDILSTSRYIKKRCPQAQHFLVKLLDADKSDCKDKLAAKADFQLATYDSEEAARKLFEQAKQQTAQMDTPIYYDKLNREWAEWTNISIAEPLDDSENRILLVGDSISSGYGKLVQELLPDCRVDLLNTSEGTHHPNFYRLLQIALSHYPYKVIHLNNGIHIHGISPEAYRQNLICIFQWIHMISPDTKIVFATTTSASRKRDTQTASSFQSENFQLGDRAPVSLQQENQSEYCYSPKDSALYIKLNELATQVCESFQIPVNDLFTLCVSRDLPKADSVHFQNEGYRVLAKAVAEAVFFAQK